VLNDVERRAFLVEPAGEHPRPALVRPFDVELDEGTGQLLGLPRRGCFTRPQADDGVLDPDRLAGPERQVADNPVALVEQAEHRHPLAHRGRPARLGIGRQGDVVDRFVGRRILAAAAGCPGKRRGKNKGEARAHAPSGVHGV
jgi:hypothetical protein